MAMNPLEIIEWSEMTHEGKDLIDVVTPYHGNNIVFGNAGKELSKATILGSDPHLIETNLVWTTMKASEGTLKKLLSGEKLNEDDVASLRYIVFGKLYSSVRDKYQEKGIDIDAEEAEEERKKTMESLWKHALTEVNDIVAKFKDPVFKARVQDKFCCSTGECYRCLNHCGLTKAGQKIDRSKLHYTYDYLEFAERKKKDKRKDEDEVEILDEKTKKKLREEVVKWELVPKVVGDKKKAMKEIKVKRNRWDDIVKTQNEQMSMVKELLKQGRRIPEELKDLPYIQPLKRLYKKKSD